MLEDVHYSYDADLNSLNSIMVNKINILIEYDAAILEIIVYKYYLSQNLKYAIIMFSFTYKSELK